MDTGSEAIFTGEVETAGTEGVVVEVGFDSVVVGEGCFETGKLGGDGIEGIGELGAVEAEVGGEVASDESVAVLPFLPINSPRVRVLPSGNSEAKGCTVSHRTSGRSFCQRSSRADLVESPGAPLAITSPIFIQPSAALPDDRFKDILA